MKVTVVGTIMHDLIFPLAGEPRESFGGILYNVLSFAGLLGADDLIRPVAKVGSEDRAEIIALYSEQFPNVDWRGLGVNPSGSDTNTLRHYAGNPDEREERGVYRTPRATVEEILQFDDSDLLLVNFIKPGEIDLSTVRAVRDKTDGFMALDLHNIVREVAPNGVLSLRPGGLPDADEWFAEFDLIQGNEEEFAAVAGKPIRSDNDVLEVSKRILDTGAKYALTTLGKRGSLLAYVSGEERYEVRMPALEPRETVDPTGCGDVFGAAFLSGILLDCRPPKALAWASAIASVNCEMPGLPNVKGEDLSFGGLGKRFPGLALYNSDWEGDAFLPR